MSQAVWIRRDHWEQMRTDVANRFPFEACGLVGGLHGKSLEVFPVQNVLESPARFLMHPEQQVRGLFMIDENGWELTAIYHSHPEGPPDPSPTDIDESHYPGVVHLIWSQSAGEWTCQGFLIDEGRVSHVPLHFYE